MQSKQHIALVCSRLDLPGGIERAIVNTANLFAEKQHQVTLVIFDESGESFYPINSKINIITKAFDFGLTEKGNIVTRKINFLKHIHGFKKIISDIKPDILITTEYVFTISAKLSTSKVKILSWEHHHFYWLKKSTFWNFLYYRIYPKIDRIICLNGTESLLFQKIGCNTSVIPNFIQGNFPQATLQSQTLLTVGWLIKRKGVDLIPKIGEDIFKKYPSWKWKIIGDGEEYENLQKAINEKGLSKNIYIVKPTSHNLSNEYSNASIYVMTSRFECFPMVLLEAMNNGVPAISFNCPTGPSDIIIHNEDGILVEHKNIVSMINAISSLIENDDKRMEFGQKARQNIQRFSADAIYNKWLQVFNNA